MMMTVSAPVQDGSSFMLETSRKRPLQPEASEVMVENKREKSDNGSMEGTWWLLLFTCAPVVVCLSVSIVVGGGFNDQ